MKFRACQIVSVLLFIVTQSSIAGNISIPMGVYMYISNENLDDPENCNPPDK
ncbi:hypothetical protein MNBD_GAMMA12-1995 [hydrothermal vent metagenome]|uniref:Uncharacterized protein n=1 Tax=hydrothermal vent metagenome TaxID=652676 RepID=A0A3B0YLK2_9ZZZZ